uniref:Uncharacterized protein n=1 Tax=Magnetococcus massalia (strain MO-1) TaxID=451514 RepID=A0A1S7LI15_MAGMO|nr:Protein of unknown function [Candidatus Magnetococcus massalia]
MPSLAWNQLPATLHEISGLGRVLNESMGAPERYRKGLKGFRPFGFGPKIRSTSLLVVYREPRCALLAPSITNFWPQTRLISSLRARPNCFGIVGIYERQPF